MASEDVVCPDCGTHIDSGEKLAVETDLPVIEVPDDPSAPPRVQLGAGRRDVYRCKGCGAVLGVN